MTATKRDIIDRYYADGWNIRVLAYNVMCDKYIQHPHYPNLALHITSTRDKATYEYCIIDD